MTQHMFDHAKSLLLETWSNDVGKSSEQSGRWRVVRVELPFESSLSSLVSWETSTDVVFSIPPNDDVEYLGFGQAARIESNASTPIQDVLEQLKSSDVPSDVHWYGGVSFPTEHKGTGVFARWPVAMWFVPTILLSKSMRQSVVRIQWIEEATMSPNACASRLDELFRRFTKRHPESAEHDSLLDEAATIADKDDWMSLVKEALLAIRAGDLEKVVLARQSPLVVTAPLPAAIQRLTSDYRTSHVFALHVSGQWLFGASPEQLVRVTDGTMYVDCLAGSTARGTDEATDARLAKALWSSAKNRAEHKAVVDYVTTRLVEVATELEYADAPDIKQLANVQHLFTPVRGRLRSGKHLLDAAARLHPTPAVGGVPVDKAISFIEQHEGWPRGYYAGAFGRMNGEGDGLLSVALRTAVVRYPEALLFAGCGIVEGSDGEEEWQETEMKLSPMRSALSLSDDEEGVR